jgi:hypothetical protein
MKHTVLGKTNMVAPKGLKGHHLNIEKSVFVSVARAFKT